MRPELIAFLHPKSPASEAFRTLRTNLQFAAAGRGRLQVILVTSPGPGEGKSVVAANLAIVLAQGGRRTLLLDGDLRRPVQHRLLEKSGRRGLTNLLAEPGREPEELVQPAGVDGLDLLPAGPVPPNPAELVATEGVRKVLEWARERYAAVVVDAPPVLAVTDAVLLATHVDGVLLVSRAGQTRNEALQAAVETLRRSQIPVVGAVLNEVHYRGSDAYYYSYYYGRRREEEQDLLAGGHEAAAALQPGSPQGGERP
ncbi:MAG: CpsD/CapB family tyrosine-protein kinase [Clostridia bacterium]|nr:CpsD/CapB family tyrosine-protein kinase [Clostridia bacterium]